MARWEFKLPDIGEGVTEGEIVSWLISPGESVKEDQPMVEVMTDKATVTIAVPRAGTVLELRGKVGDIVAVHSTLVVFDVGGGATDAPRNGPHANGSGNGHGAGKPGADGPAATAVGDIRETLPGMARAASPQLQPSAPPAAKGPGGSSAGATETYFNDKPLATPATRKTARELGIDLKRVPPTGPQGRVTRDDVQTFADAEQSPAAAPLEAVTPAAGASATVRPPAASNREPVRIAPPVGAAGALEERVPFAGLRRRIATKMAASTSTAAHFTFVEECDVSALDETTNELVYRKYFNIGIAASTDAGLVVPVVKNADRKSLLDIAREIDRLATDAKDGKSKVEDLSGSTFTITSLGAQGGLFATPIINFPEVGILGVHQIKQKPVVRDGQIAIGEVMLLSLSFDHRIVDGHIGAAFAYDVIGFLENPDRLFLEMA